MIKVYLPKAWGESNVLDLFKHQTPNNSGIWEDIQAVDNKDDADYIIVQDECNEPIDMKKTIFFGREPKHIQGMKSNWFTPNTLRYYHHEVSNCWLPQTWWVKLPYNQLVNMESPNKTKNLSVIDSGKTITNNHTKRRDVVLNLANKYPNDIDIWGKIVGGRINQRPYMNSLPYRQKDGGLLDYRYNLAIENGSTDFYFSEKICDPLLCWTLPIYWGCKNIDKFLPKGSYILVDIEKNDCVDEIIRISKSSYREENMDAIREARELILKKYNLWSTIKLAINDQIKL